MKIKNFFMFMAMAAVALTSCNKDNDGGGFEDEEINFYLKMDLNPATTKADTDKAPEVKATFKSGALYFADAAGTIVRSVRITEQFATGTVTPQQLEVGYLFAGIDASATRVLIVGNVDGLDPQGYASITALETAISISILEQTDDDFGITDATLFGESPLSSVITLSGAIAAGANREAKVDLRPLIARFEIVKVSGATTATPAVGDIKDGFKLEAIYIDDFFLTSTVTGTYSNFQNIVYDDGVSWEYYSRHKPGPFTSGTFTHLGYQTTGWYEYLFDDGDDDNSGGINGLGTASSNVIAPQEEVWAYNLYADAGNVPHIILHLTDVEVYDGSAYVPFANTKTGNAGEAYLTVTGFRNKTTNASITPEGGYIYRIENLLFNGSNLREEPEGPDPTDPSDKLDVWVEVELMKWTVIDTDPIFN